MPPPLAALVYFGLALYLLRADLQQRKASPALWIPLAWMFVVGTRSLNAWLHIGAPADYGNPLDGSPIDRAFFIAVMVAGIAVLIRRRLSWGRLLASNGWIVLFFFLGAASATWSPYPLVSLRRLVKALGNALMALIILTDQQPRAALSVVLGRLSILAFPLSILFIKYYPELGRTYHMGMPMFTGISSHKNGLGQICLLGAVAASWNLLYQRKNVVAIGGRLRVPADVVLLVMAGWLLHMANSATSTTCLALALSLLGLGRLPAVARRPRRILLLVAASVLAFAVMDSLFSLRSTFLDAVGRDTNLTTRVPMWQDLMQKAEDPILGSGYEMFWETPGSRDVQSVYKVANAHNGYLEVYLNLGVVGLVLFVVGIIAAFPNVARHLTLDLAPAMLRLVWLVVVPAYNWTEAAFRGADNLWMLLMFAQIVLPQALAVRRRVSRPARATPGRIGWGSRRAGQERLASHDGARTGAASRVVDGQQCSYRVRNRVHRL